MHTIFAPLFKKVDLAPPFLKVDLKVDFALDFALDLAPPLLKVDFLKVDLAPPFLKVGNKGHKFVFVIYSDITIIHHRGQSGIDRVSIHHQKGE